MLAACDLLLCPEVSGKFAMAFANARERDVAGQPACVCTHGLDLGPHPEVEQKQRGLLGVDPVLRPRLKGAWQGTEGIRGRARRDVKDDWPCQQKGQLQSKC